MAGLHQPGDTILHRLPVGAKVLGLAVLSLSIVVVRDVRTAPVFLAVTLLLAALARVPLRSVWRAARGVLLIAVVASAFQWWWYGGEKAAETFLDLLSLGLAALSLTATTSVNEMVDALSRWARPLRVIGVDPDRVALTVALTIGALPGTIAIAARDPRRGPGARARPQPAGVPLPLRDPRRRARPRVRRRAARARDRRRAHS